MQPVLCVSSGVNLQTLEHFSRPNKLSVEKNSENTQSKPKITTNSVYDDSQKQAHQISNLWPFHHQFQPKATPSRSVHYHVFTNSTSASQRFAKEGCECVRLTVFIDDTSIILRFKRKTPQYLSCFGKCQHYLLDILVPIIKQSEANTPASLPSMWQQRAAGVWPLTSCPVLKLTWTPWTRINVHMTQRLTWNDNLSAKIS